MKSAAKANGISNEITRSEPLLRENSESLNGSKITVQQALCKWYHLLNGKINVYPVSGSIFTGVSENQLLQSLQTDLEIAPSLLMEEFISHPAIFNKEQYIRLVQALLVNISNILFEKQNDCNAACISLQTVLNFIQNFFYQYFDLDGSLPKFNALQLHEVMNCKFKNLYSQITQPKLLNVLQECILDKITATENTISYRQVNYLHHLIQQFENVSLVNSENYTQEICVYNNFNAAGFTDYEIELIKIRLDEIDTYDEAISFLQAEQIRIARLKIKSGIFFSPHNPTVKKQLLDWVTEEIKQHELKNKKANDKDLLIDTESKIQTSLSVARLAVLIRLLVVDKIIINRTVAPMLKTVSKLFTTLQKDEISFGSLETKYHAPDKSTLNVMKEMLHKWLTILGKL